MKDKRLVSLLCIAALSVSVLAGCVSGTDAKPTQTAALAEVPEETMEERTDREDSASEQTAEAGQISGSQTGEFIMNSQEYIEAMGHGWNLGNSFDGVNTDEKSEDLGETAWGNPAVTKELIHSVKEKGFKSIRIPLTMFRRYTREDGKYIIDPDWLARYKEVVDWAVEEDLYVMVNIHHDSWIWLKYWDGDTESEEYIRFVQLWEQLAEVLKDEPEQVCFETINEPDFEEGTDEEKQAKLDAVNLAAYHTIRESGGNNDRRMIVMPTMNTNHEKCVPLLKLIQELEDSRVIATVHYYSEWVYSANLGITGFDEMIDEEKKSARIAADKAMSIVHEMFTDNGIGVIVGEYGLLGYDKGEKCNQPGEELKYYEYMNELSRKYHICLMFWDNGSGIDRTNGKFSWKKPLAGKMLEASSAGRSSYSEGLDTLYFEKEAETDVEVSLILNGNTFAGIQGLTEGEEYTYSSDAAVVTLKAEYINQLFSEQSHYGLMKELVFQFSSGADWHEKLVKFAPPEFEAASGTVDGLTIPVQYNGAELRRISAYSGEEYTGPHSDWWKYLENSYAYFINEDEGTLTLTSSFFAECAEGEIKLVIEFFDGQTKELVLIKDGNDVHVNGD